MNEIVYPAHYRVVECRSGRWFMRNAELFYGNPHRCEENIESVYGISTEQLLINLFRVNGGCSGFYLVNLKHRKYYYCGQNWEDIRTQLLKLGIGRKERLAGD